ncbi:hypothetical protein [Undibacterium rugosum]|uniref:Lipoprotein n=1 Tax=Undibacterium rugosum TaxID=2762291 RepID=A0A923I0C3_9BURK|nr:hypothetical protein [Undibacterium rugosum]MBC3934122.1 hypothetical protein [Undibacterium rugosum]MBR7779147.1 hypothetical protein [Undibacterium rugosum]
MKKSIPSSLLILSLIAALSACGGGSSDNAGNASGNSSGSSGSGGSSGGSSGGGSGGSSGTGSSAGLTEALKVFAESWIATQMVNSLHDFAVIAGNTGNCPKGGSVSYAGGTTSMSNCVRRFPADNAYQGAFSGVPNQIGNIKMLNFQSSTAIKVNAGDNPALTQYQISNASFTATDDNSDSSKELTQIGGGAASFSLGTGSYNMTAVAGNATNTGSSLSIANGFFYTRNNAAANRVVNLGNIVYGAETNGMTTRPTSGKYNVAVGGSSTACVNVGVQLISLTQLTITCEATKESRTLNWTDADLKAALTAAQN